MLRNVEKCGGKIPESGGRASLEGFGLHSN